MAKRGRKQIEINWSDFEKLCSMQCTLIEIASWFKCSEDTVERACKRQYGENFADVYKKKSCKGKISLRRQMFETALGGNVTMMIWLSKQHLGFSDKLEQATEAKVEQKNEITYVASWGGSQEPESHIE